MRYSILLIPAVLLAQAGNPPAGAARGKKLFFDEGPKCATCHMAEGKGAKVGPDLTRLARLHPKGLKTAILATVTEYVVLARLKSGPDFPAMRFEQAGDTVKLWDLSQTPPRMRSVNSGEIRSYGANTVWKHPPSSAGLSNGQLADIMSYIRFVAYQDTKGVRADELE